MVLVVDVCKEIGFSGFRVFKFWWNLLYGGGVVRSIGGLRFGMVENRLVFVLFYCLLLCLGCELMSK